MDRSATADLVFLCAAAVVMAAGYALDLAGLSIAPPALLAVFLGALGAAVHVFRPRLDPGFLCVAGGMFGYAVWLASPAFLPVTNGPDVVHHLQLIHLIADSHRLPHDPSLSPYLLEMMGYTPGSHVLAAAAAAWLRADALRILYPMAALFAAIKAGSVYVLARRVIATVPGGALAALAAPLLALVPSAYSLGSFVQFFFFAQVVSEAFAIGLLVALLRWRGTAGRRDVAAVSICAVGVVLSWPVWIAPCAVAVAFAVAAAPLPWRHRVATAAWMLGPAVMLAAVHQLTHRGAASIVTASGAVTAPSPSTFGISFLVLAGAGIALARRDREARIVCVFLLAILLQAALLGWLALRAGASTPYLAFKMMYLVVPVGAVLGAFALARNASLLIGRARRVGALVPVVVLLVAILLVRGRVPVRRAHGSLSLAARDVGLWARSHVPPTCVDYFSRYWLTGYWLHLDVLGNPRLSDRMQQETFDFPDVAAKWIEGRGLPYAIVEDMTAIPREIRPDMEPLHQSGAFVLVRNRRAAACQ